MGQKSGKRRSGKSCRGVAFALGCALLLALPGGSAHGFTTDGALAYRMGRAYLNPELRDGDYLRDERAAVIAMPATERYVKAIEYFDQAARGDPSGAEQERLTASIQRAANEASLAFDRNKQYREAAEYGKRAVDAGGDKDPVLRMNMGEWYKMTGQTADAASEFEKALELSGGNAALRKDIRERLVGVLRQRAVDDDATELNRALELIDEGLREDPRSESLLINKGMAYYGLGKWDESVKAWTDLAELRPLSEGEASRLDEARKRGKVLNDRGDISMERAGFVLTFDPDFDPAQDPTLTDTVVNLLHDARERLSETFRVKPAPRTNVFMHRAADYDAHIAFRASGGQYVCNTIDLPVYQGSSREQLANVVFHEYAHQLTFQKANGTVPPTWYMEGIAMNLEPNEEELRWLKLGIKAYKQKRMPSYEVAQTWTGLAGDDVLFAYAAAYH